MAMVLLLPVIAMFVFVGSGIFTGVQATEMPEYQVKAAFLYNFAKFIDWPAEAFADNGTPISICLLGQDPFGSILDETVKNKTVNGRKFLIRRFKELQSLETCHILFVSASEKRNLAHSVKALAGTSVLTVGEVEKFCQQGGIINLVIKGNKAGIEVNESAAGRARLKISSKLLKLATLVAEER